MVKSPLRYPGAKSRVIDQILPLISDFVEYREPFVGGGSVFLAVKDKYGIEKNYWINDLNPELYNFWKQIQQNVDEMIKQLLKWKNDFNDKDGKQLQQYLKTNSYKFNEIELGSAYLALNRMSFSGLPRGFSQHNFETTYTEEKIKSLKSLSEILQETKITNLDYSKLVEAPGEDVFLFCDPPYYNVKWPELYGKSGKGNFHMWFDHYKFAEVMKKCKHKWLITYDDSQTIRKLFDWANVIPWELTYTSRKVKTGQELFISNYLEEKEEKEEKEEITKQKQANILNAWG